MHRYKKLHKLATEIQGLCSKDARHVTQMVKNKSDAVHKIGNQIARLRYSKARGDIHTIVELEFHELALELEYREHTKFYFLSQQIVKKHFVQKWSSNSEEDLAKVTDADRLRVMGILFQDDGMREYTTFIMLKPDRSIRLLHEKLAPRKRKGICLVTEKFRDEDVKIVFPVKWYDLITKQKFDEKVAEKSICLVMEKSCDEDVKNVFPVK